MVLIKSQTLQNYYGTDPNEYYIKFIHHNIDISTESDEEYTKIAEDFKKLYDLDNEAFLIYFSDLENYIKTSSHIDIENAYKGKVYLRIRSVSEYEILKKYVHFKNVKLIVDLNDLEKIDIKDLDLVVQIDKISELSEERLNSLLEKYRIREVLLGQIPYLSKEDNHLYEIMAKMYNIDSSRKLELEKVNKITNDIYTVADYIKIIQIFQRIIKHLDIQDPIDGFYKVFEYIARNVSYDDDGVTYTKITNQNLIGAVLSGKSVCEGYSKFLQQMLSLINIDSIVVQGGGKKEEGGHVWNQVFIDGKWYNADVTVASYNIHHNEQIRTCLVSDDRLLYKTTSSISHICNETYEKNISGKNK